MYRRDFGDDEARRRRALSLLRLSTLWNSRIDCELVGRLAVLIALENISEDRRNLWLAEGEEQ